MKKKLLGEEFGDGFLCFFLKKPKGAKVWGWAPPAFFIKQKKNQNKPCLNHLLFPLSFLFFFYGVNNVSRLFPLFTVCYL